MGSVEFILRIIDVSYRELGQITSLDPKTVGGYIDILEKAFIVFRLGSFSRNLRNEIRTGRKIYKLLPMRIMQVRFFT